MSLLQVGHGLGEAREIVEFARQEALLEVVDIVDQELLRAVDVVGEFPDHVAVHHVLEADPAHRAFRRLGERDLLVDRQLVIFARAGDRDRVEHQR